MHVWIQEAYRLYTIHPVVYIMCLEEVVNVFSETKTHNLCEYRYKNPSTETNEFPDQLR